MNRRRIFGALSSCFAGVLLCSAAQASVSVTGADLNSSRTTIGTTGSGNGLVWNPAAGDWSGGKFSIAWEISVSGVNNWSYKYTVKTPGALGGTGAQLSHWLLELSPETIVTPGTAPVSLQSYWEDVFSNQTQGSYTGTGVTDPVPLAEIKTRPPGNPAEVRPILDSVGEADTHSGDAPTSMRSHFPPGILAPRPVSLRQSCS